MAFSDSSQVLAITDVLPVRVLTDMVDCGSNTYCGGSGEGDQHSALMPISVPG